MSNPKNDPKFLHLAYHIHDNLFQDRIMIGGFYNWHKVFDGDFSLYRNKAGNLEDYDILFCGLSRPELDGIMISKMRQEIGWDSNTKIVVVIDYARELWVNTFNPWSLERELLQADMIFTAEPSMGRAVTALIQNRRPVFHIPHPSNTDAIQEIAKPTDQRLEAMATIIHRYDNNWYDMFLVDKNLDNIDNHVVLLDPNIELQILAYFKFTKHGFQFTQYLEWVSNLKMVLDSYHKIHTYGRTAVDNASLQLPTVGSDWTWSQKYLWPSLTVPAGDVWSQVAVIKKLLSDNEFYLDAVEYASDKVDLYRYQNRKQDLLNKLYN